MKKYTRLVVIVISILTILSGVIQLIDPALVLKNVGIEPSAVARQLFATIAMFMILFGGMVIHGVYSVYKNNVIILWAALQKFGASLAVGIGIIHGIFNLLSAGVAFFDLCSGFIFIYYYQSLKADESY